MALHDTTVGSRPSRNRKNKPTPVAIARKSAVPFHIVQRTALIALGIVLRDFAKIPQVISAFLHDEQRDRTTPDHSSSALTAKKRPHKLNYQLDLDPRAPVLAHQLVAQGSTGAS